MTGVRLKKLVPLEHEEQVALIDWWALAHKGYGLPEFALFAIPNAGAGASRGQAGKMKAEGARRGMFDLCLAVARYGMHGLYIEMKRQNAVPSSTSPEQVTVGNYLNEAGYAVAVCKGADTAIDVIKDYLA